MATTNRNYRKVFTFTELLFLLFLADSGRSLFLLVFLLILVFPRIRPLLSLLRSLVLVLFLLLILFAVLLLFLLLLSLLLVLRQNRQGLAVGANKWVISVASSLSLRAPKGGIESGEK